MGVYDESRAHVAFMSDVVKVSEGVFYDCTIKLVNGRRHQVIKFVTNIVVEKLFAANP